MEKVDSKLVQIKKDMQKILKEKEDKKEENPEEERSKQTDIIVKEQRQIYGMLANKFKEVREKNAEGERTDDSFKHNLMGQMKEQNDKIVNSIMKFWKKYKKKGMKILLLKTRREMEYVSYARTQAITLRTALTKKRENQRELTIQKEGLTIRKEDVNRSRIIRQ